MNHYDNAQEQEQAALCLIKAGFYRQSVYLSCMAIELYLKSKLPLVPHDESLEYSHDIVGMLNALSACYKPKNTNLRRAVSFCRKYFNESRYPYAADTSAYNKDFANDFAGYVADIRNYINNECNPQITDSDEMTKS